MAEEKRSERIGQSELGQVESLTDGEHSVSVDLVGGKITQLVLGGKTVLGSFDRIDGGVGETHPCTPNFGPVDEKYGVKQHGPGRKLPWERVSDDGDEKLKMRLEIDGDDYPKFAGLVVEQAFSFESGEFVVTTTHTNNGKDKMPINFGEHFYFNTPLVSWDGLEINGRSMKDKVKNTGVIGLLDENIISGLSVGEIILKQEGLEKAVLWTGRNREEEFDKHYVCIEPVEGSPVEGNNPGFFGSDDSMIPSGESRTTVIKLSLKD